MLRINNVREDFNVRELKGLLMKENKLKFKFWVKGRFARSKTKTLAKVTF